MKPATKNQLIVDSYIVDGSLPLTSKLSTNQPRLSFFCDLTFSLTFVSELAFCKVRNLYSFVSASFSSALVGVNRGFKKYVFAGIKRKSILFSIKSLVLLTALATILVLLTAITVSATVYSPWTREAVDTTSTTDIQCAKVGDADNDGLVEVVIGIDGMGDNIYMYESPSPDSTLRFIDPTPANYTQEQDFTWGVLAINTHKSIYLPNETAFIGIAVLDNEGRMVCDADVTLTITDPGNNATVLSTSNGLIKVSPQCCVYGVTNLPDYYTNYEVGGAGTYVMNLTVTAVTADGTKSITDVFSVQNSVDFDVARDGPTRIYPPVPYVMNFTIKVNKNYYTGLIREYVPASFVITPQDGLTVTTVCDTKVLTWTKNLVEGETYNIYYEFDAPDVSPYLFTLGALEIGNWKEARQWQIASDATVTYYFNAYDIHERWLHNAADMVDNNLTTYASCDKDNGTQLLLTNNCTGTDLGTISKVEIQAYGYMETPGDSVSLRPVFTDGDGTNHTAITATTPGWGPVPAIDITTDNNAPSAWIWSNVSTLDCDVVCHHDAKDWSYCAKVWINVTYYTPTLWASYNCSGHTPECQDDTFSDDEHTVYMHGEGFLTSHLYRVAYYDAGGAHRETDTVSSIGGNLDSNCVFTSYPGSSSGLWHAIVCDGTADPPSTYDSVWAYIIKDDSFTVDQSAIPEFPTVIAAIAVCLLCAVAYVVMRRKAGKR